MKLLIAGSSGLVGTELCRELEADSANEVVRLIREKSSDTSDKTAIWQPNQDLLSPEVFSGVDAVIHLGGVNIADKRWTSDVKQAIFNSRVQSTKLLANTMASLETPPSTFLCASAIGFYGNRSDERLHESSERGQGFLADVCDAWEHATQPAASAGIRVINMRLGMILDKREGALAKMLTPFKLGAGGKVGAGSQYWSWIALPDVIKAIQFCLQNKEIEGPVNFVAPDEVTNLEFTKTLGTVLSRPTALPVPAWGIKALLGEMGQELILSSARVTPQGLLDAGYQFQYAKLESALRGIL